MMALPEPRRFVFKQVKPLDDVRWYFDMYTDSEVADFVALLAPVNHSEWLNRTFRVCLDPRYAHSNETAQKVYEWITEQVVTEFDGTEIPIKPQEE